MSNIVAIVGRPNVGKSTLFNRLIGSRKAIVNEESGVTRDRNYGKSEWNGKEFSVIDTGGYVSNSDDIFEEEINKQVLLAIEEADVILFMVDTEIGLTDLDQNFANYSGTFKSQSISLPTKSIPVNGFTMPVNFTVWASTAIYFASLQQTDSAQENYWIKLRHIFKRIPWKVPIICPVSPL